MRWSGYGSDFDTHEIFLENHAGKFTAMLPKEIQLDQKFHWEMALVELFWPKQDSVAVIENLWNETQGPRKGERELTFQPLHL